MEQIELTPRFLEGMSETFDHDLCMMCGRNIIGFLCSRNLCGSCRGKIEEKEAEEEYESDIELGIRCRFCGEYMDEHTKIVQGVKICPDQESD